MSRLKKIYRWQISIMKRCSMPYVIRKKQIKTKRYHYTPIRMAKSLILITQTTDKEGTFIYSCRNAKSYSHSGRQFVGFSKKLNILLP